jgi:putative transposase
MLRTASIRLDVAAAQSQHLDMLRAAYANACNRLVPIVREHRVWNRVALHQQAYSMLREATPLGSQMCCNAIFSVCRAYKAQKALGKIKKDEPVPELRFERASVHFDRAHVLAQRPSSLALHTEWAHACSPPNFGHSVP